MNKKIILILSLFSLTFCVYNVGQTISNSDQNLELYDCDTSSEGYSFCSSFQTEGDCDQIAECSWTNNNSSNGNYCKSPSKLSDWNGLTNGGDYHVIWLEMSASW
tara:strand:+ start:87 stop:401 length:315 start_codon:yes stop_codon:yes gene_type:complete